MRLGLPWAGCRTTGTPGEHKEDRTRPSLTPLVTQFGIDVDTVLGGAIVTKSVFGLPGLGRAVGQSIQNQDLPVIQGVVILASGFAIIANIMVDAVYALLDARVRLA